MRVAVDTNAYVAFCRGEKRAVEWIRRADELALPVIVIGELRAGFRCGSKGNQNERQLQLFLNSPRLHVLAPDEETTHHYATLFAQLKRAGTPIPTNDLWIASLVLQHDLQLLSFDEHFELIPQISRV